WAVLAVSLIIEVAAAIRGQPAPRLPAIAPAQALAAALVGATLLTVLHASKPSPRGAQPLHAALTSATTISAPLLPGQPAHPATATATAADRAASSGNPNEPRPRVYRVKDGDDLWAIARQYLGNGEDWHQIYQLNEGRPQADGRALTDPDEIYSGWVLLISQPGHAQAGTAHQDPAPTASSATSAPAVSHPADPLARPSPQARPSARPSDPAGPPALLRRPARQGLPLTAARPRTPRTRERGQYGCGRVP
ncbi:MAG TPA: LysM peptidoglycan-binding domain-containing protein, partial [Trebonia sp.]